MALRAVTGFGFGPALGLAIGNAGNRLFDTVTGTPTITSNTARTGAYCLEVSAAGAAEAVAWSSSTLGASQTRGRVVLAVRAVGSLPAADVVLASFTAGTNAELRYHQSTGKLSVVYEGGVQTDGPTWTADTWTVVELYADMSTAGAKFIDWWVGGVAQTRHNDTGAADAITAWEWGCSFAAQTMTIRYADTAVWTDTAAIAGPVGEQRVYLLTVDTAGTTAQIGTANATARFINNGTVDATHSSSNILAALVEVPPTISAASSGVAQRVSGITNAVGLPMATRTLAAGEVLTAGGCRVLVCGWAASTQANQIGLRAFNGTTETILFAAADPGFDNSTTAPAWLCKMYAGVTNQTTLDALVVRLGYSGDISPIPGAHAVYAEVAVTIAGTQAAGATLAATATLTAAATAASSVAATLATTATLAAAAARSTTGAASLSVTASLGTTTGVDRSAAATLATTATLTAAVTPQRAATASLPASATLMAGATTTALPAAALSASAALSATALATLSAGATLPVSATLTAAATVTSVGLSADAVLAATATLTAGATVTTLAAATLSATASLSASAFTTALAAAGLAATATLSASAARTVSAAAGLSTSVGLVAGPTLTALAAATLAATATLSAAATVGTPPLLAAASLTVTATLSAVAVHTALPGVSLAATVALVAGAAASYALVAQLAATASMSAGAQRVMASAAALAVVVSLVAEAIVGSITPGTMTSSTSVGQFAPATAADARLTVTTSGGDG